MVILSKPPLEQQLSLIIPHTNTMLSSSTSIIPLIDLSKPDPTKEIVKACEEYGFFKVINHGVPIEFISRLEKEAKKFFSLSLVDKQKIWPPNPYGYGNKKIGNNGDVGCIEYLLMNINPLLLDHDNFPSLFSDHSLDFRCAVRDYVGEVKRMACKVLELIADGLGIKEREVFSKLLKDEKSDSIFRVNHYPLCPSGSSETEPAACRSNNNRIGFGEHTDPQIISVLRSNNTSGLEILLPSSNWLPVPPDQDSFFFNVGDSLQVMTNGRFKSVRHRVITNKFKSRISMIYFGGPPMSEKIAPLPSLLTPSPSTTGGGDHQIASLYKEFTWFEYKNSAYKTRLADNRLVPFEKISAS